MFRCHLSFKSRDISNTKTAKYDFCVEHSEENYQNAEQEATERSAGATARLNRPQYRSTKSTKLCYD